MADKPKQPKIDPAHVDRGQQKLPHPSSDFSFVASMLPSLGLWDDDQPAQTPREKVTGKKAGSEFMDRMAEIVRLADKMCVIAKRKGLRAIKAKCPDCEGHLQLRYNGPRAFRFWCDGTCGKQLMG